ncbi:hypothetical protein ABIB39_001402 [Mucilaginibacter sp. UYP27]
MRKEVIEIALSVLKVNNINHNLFNKNQIIPFSDFLLDL